MMATFGGVLLFWTVPASLSSALGMQLPEAFTRHIAAIMTGSTILCNCLTVAFLR